VSLLHGTVAVTVEVGGIDVTEYLRDESLVVHETLDGDIPTAEFVLEDTSNALDVSPWQEVVIKVNGTRVWGGYVIRPIPTAGPGGTHRVWTMRCEGYARRFRHTDDLTRAWQNATPQTIVADMLSALGLAGEFDGTTYVPASPSVTAFSVRDVKLAEALDRLGAITGLAWYVDSEKRIRMIDTSSAMWNAPFEVATIGIDAATLVVADAATEIIVASGINLVATAAVNWSTVFPVNAGLSVDYGDVVINRVVVYGGWSVVGPIAEAFTGDGSTTSFALSQHPIHSIVYVEVDGVLKSFGTMWVHSFSDYDALIDYSDGVVYFSTAPASGATIRVAYRHMDRVTYEAVDAASYATIGFYITHTIHDPTISTEDKAAAVASALLDEFADVPERITFTVERGWLVPGYVIHCNFPLYGINGNYLIREVTTRFKRDNIVVHQVTVGGRPVRMGETLAGMLRGYGGKTAADPYGPAGLVPTITGTTDEQTVGGVIMAIDPRTTFQAGS